MMMEVDNIVRSLVELTRNDGHVFKKGKLFRIFGIDARSCDLIEWKCPCIHPGFMGREIGSVSIFDVEKIADGECGQLPLGENLE